MENVYYEIDSNCGYYMFSVDDEGYLVDDAIDYITAAIKETEYTDVVLFAHGWNTSYNEDNSIIFANNLIPRLENEKPSTTKTLYICFKWPSLVTYGVRIAYGFGGKKESEEKHNKIMKSLWEDRGITVPEQFKYEDLDASEKHLLKRFAKSFGKKFALSQVFGVLGTIGLMSYSTQDAVFRHLTRRAYMVGARGLHMLIASIMRITSSSTRIHVYGFSMGATVALASSIGTAPGSALTRKIHSLFIFQGAVNHDWLRPGEVFRPICNTLEPVAGHVIITYAEKDLALIGFNVANSAFRMNKKMQAIGHKGADVESEPMNCVQTTVQDVIKDSYSLTPKTIYNVDCGGLNGFHHHCLGMKEIVKLFLKTATSSIDESLYNIKDHDSLPDGFWTDYTTRTL